MFNRLVSYGSKSAIKIEAVHVRAIMVCLFKLTNYLPPKTIRFIRFYAIKI